MQTYTPNPDYSPDSFYNVLHKRIYDCCLYEKDADAILRQVIESKAETNQLMKGRWGDRAGDYPAVMTELLWGAVKEEALVWIDKNMPGHFARMMFFPNLEKAIEGVKATRATSGPKPSGKTFG